MREVTPEALEAMIPKDATAIFFVYKPHYDRTGWVAHVVAQLINPDLGKHKRAIVWFAKGVSENDALQMMQEVDELVEADTVGGNSDSRPSDAPQENVHVYFDICANVDASLIRKAERILRNQKHSKRRKRRV